MSGSKHTPGPWVIEARGGHELTGVEAEIAEMEDCEAYALRQLKIVAPSKPNGAKRRNKETGKFDIPAPATVCEITYDPRDPGGDVREADARMIASAPELLEACKAALEAIGLHEYHDTGRLIAAAIAKAEGRS